MSSLFKIFTILIFISVSSQSFSSDEERSQFQIRADLLVKFAILDAMDKHAYLQKQLAIDSIDLPLGKIVLNLAFDVPAMIATGALANFNYHKGKIYSSHPIVQDILKSEKHILDLEKLISTQVRQFLKKRSLLPLDMREALNELTIEIEMQRGSKATVAADRPLLLNQERILDKINKRESFEKEFARHIEIQNEKYSVQQSPFKSSSLGEKKVGRHPYSEVRMLTEYFEELKTNKTELAELKMIWSQYKNFSNAPKIKSVVKRFGAGLRAVPLFFLPAILATMSFGLLAEDIFVLTFKDQEDFDMQRDQLRSEVEDLRFLIKYENYSE